MNRTLKWGPIGGCESPHSKRGEEAFSHARQASQGLFCGEERQSWAKPDAYPDVLTCLCLSWPGWRNWQTQRTQNPPRFTPRGGSTPPPGTIILCRFAPNRRRLFFLIECHSAPAAGRSPRGRARGRVGNSCRFAPNRRRLFFLIECHSAPAAGRSPRGRARGRVVNSVASLQTAVGCFSF